MYAKQKIYTTCVCVVFFCLSGLISGCLDETYECPAGFRLRIETLNPNHPVDEIIETLTLWFYSDKGELVHEIHLDAGELRASKGELNIMCLLYGNYRVAAIANESDYFTISGINRIDELTTRLVREGDTPLPHLHTGMQSFTYDNQNEGTNVATVTLIKQTKHINLEVLQDKGENLTSIHSYITGANGSYHYATHTSPDSHTVVYTPDNESTGEDYARFRITTLRLWTGADIDLIVGAVTLDLVETLGRVRDQQGNLLYDTDDKLEYQDEYDIVMKLDKTFAIIGLSVNGWQVIHGELPVK